MRKEVVGAIRTNGDNWYFETEDILFSADVVTALDELIGEYTEEGNKYKITIERLN